MEKLVRDHGAERGKQTGPLESDGLDSSGCAKKKKAARASKKRATCAREGQQPAEPAVRKTGTRVVAAAAAFRRTGPASPPEDRTHSPCTRGPV